MKLRSISAGEYKHQRISFSDILRGPRSSTGWLGYADILDVEQN
jgi:hypothetical protein